MKRKIDANTEYWFQIKLAAYFWAGVFYKYMTKLTWKNLIKLWKVTFGMICKRLIIDLQLSKL